MANRFPGASVEVGLVACVLLGALVQVGLGARYSESGEQVGLAVPVATLVLAAALIGLLLRRRRVSWPLLGGWQTVWLVLACGGLLGMARGRAPLAVKELVQLAEVGVVAPYVGWLAAERLGLAGVARVWGWVGGGLLALGVTRLAGSAVVGLSPTKYAALVVMAWPFWAGNLATSGRAGAVLLAASGLVVGATFANGGLVFVWLEVVWLSAWWPRRGADTSPAVRDGAAAPGPAAGTASAAAAAGRPCLPRWAGLAAAALGLVLSLVPVPGRDDPWEALNPRFDREHPKRLVIEAAAALRAPRHMPLGAGLGCYKTGVNYLKQYGRQQPHPRDEKVPRDGNCQYLVTLVESGVPAAVALFVLLVAVAAGALRSARRAGSEGGAAAAAGVALLGAAFAGLFCVTLSHGIGIWVGCLVGLAGSACPVRASGFVRARLLAVGAAAAAGLAAVVLNRQPAAVDGTPSPANRLLARALLGQRPATAMALRVIPLPDELATGPSGDGIQVEGEAFASKSYPFTRVQANGASGNWVLAIPNKTAKGVGQAVYELDVAQEGTYVLYARVYWEDGCSNSLEFRVGEEAFPLSSELFESWHVLEARQPVVLRPGKLKVTLQNLEDGVRLDYWGLRRCGPAAPAAGPGTGEGGVPAAPGGAVPAR